MADADSYFAKQDVITDVHELEHFVADHSDQVCHWKSVFSEFTGRLIVENVVGTGCASVRVGLEAQASGDRFLVQLQYLSN